MKKSIQITIINRTPKCIKQKLTELKREIDNSTIKAGDFNAHFQRWIDQLGRKPTRK